MTITLNADTGITFPDSTVKYGNIPQVTLYTSGSGTYTTPTGCKYLFIRMVGAGGGGGGSGPGGSGNAGTNGSSSTFGTSLLTCAGGVFGVNGGAGTGGGAGGTATINSPATGLALTGNQGFPYSPYNTGTTYTSGPYGGLSAFCAGVNTSSASLYGCGGSGGSTAGSSVVVGQSGGAGGYLEAYITSPSATYSYAVGTGGTGGTAGSGGNNGWAGGNGIIYITAYF